MLVDAENVRRSIWPNVEPVEVVELAGRWAEQNSLSVLVVFDGPVPAGAVGTDGESADDLIAREAAKLAARREPYWLVTSDRGLQARAGEAAKRVVGGGAFVRALQARPRQGGNPSRDGYT